MTGAQVMSATHNDSPYVISVSKQDHTLGSTKVVLDDVLYREVVLYVRYIVPYVLRVTSSVSELAFLSWSGEKLDSGHVSPCFQSSWKRARLGDDVNCTLLESRQLLPFIRNFLKWQQIRVT
jgi:hypothetical protein